MLSYNTAAAALRPDQAIDAMEDGRRRRQQRPHASQETWNSGAALTLRQWSTDETENGKDSHDASGAQQPAAAPLRLELAASASQHTFAPQRLLNLHDSAYQSFHSVDSNHLAKFNLEAMAFNSLYQQQSLYTPPPYAFANSHASALQSSNGSRQHPYPASHHTPANPQMDPTMNVLNAETYIDESARMRGGRKKRQNSGGNGAQPVALYGGITVESPAPPKRARKQTHTSDDQEDASIGEGRRKKKPRLSEDEGDDDSTRKSRGRPRLDTKDETAADRRRTQIRLAQRAYRNRKETTISVLEKQVQELRGANEEMSNIFMSLYDFAMKKGGVVEREPEFARQLRATTSQFLSLASAAGDESVKDEESTAGGTRRQSQSILDQESAIDHLQIDQSASSEQITPPVDPIWGYQITHDDSGSSSLFDYNSSLPKINPYNDHLVIARATPDNASFPGFDTNAYNNDVQQWRVEVPEQPEVFQQWTEIREPLPLAETMSQLEGTFARRLTRYAAERAYKLLDLEFVVPRRFNEVFAFTLQFETRDQMKKRFEMILSEDDKGPLYAWYEPFVHLGGSGTYYPNYDKVNTQLMPKLRTGMSMGPFSEAVISTRDKSMFDEYRMSMPGFTGEFFDPDDVASYLYNKGIDLSTNPDFVTIDLDQLVLAGSEDTVSTGAPITPKESTDSFLDIIVNDVLDHNPQSPIKQYGQDLGSNYVPEMNQIPPQTIMKTPATYLDFTTRTGQDPIQETNMPNLRTASNSPVEQRIVTLSVKVLVQELVNEAKCLGRTAGFKASGVDSALRRAINKSLQS